MPNVNFVSTTLPKFVAEAARRLMEAERALPAPLANVTMSFGDTLLTVSGSLPVGSSIDLATGNVVIAFSDYTTGSVPVLTGTALSDVTASSLSEVLYNAVIRLDAAEAARIAAAGTLPLGAGSTFTISEGQASFTAVLPVVYTLDVSGNQVATVPNYLA